MRPKRIMKATFLDDGDTVRLVIGREESVGDTLIAVFGQSREALSMPQADPEQWMRDMAVWLLEEL